MASERIGDTYRYSIDSDGVIVSVSNNWQAFAEENQAARSVFPLAILGTSLWDHIHDAETCYLYAEILKRLRGQNRSVTLPFRCDTPALRRFLDLTIVPREDDGVDFISKTRNIEARPPVSLWRADSVRSDEVIQVCSMCKKLALADDDWVEVEVAVQRLGLFEWETMPQLSHGVCPTCYRLALDALERDGNDAGA